MNRYHGPILDAAGAILQELRECRWLTGDIYEDDCNLEIANRLTARAAFPARTGAGNNYPASRRNCDLIVSLPENRRLWLETKVAWWIWPASDGAINRSLCTKHMISRTDNSAYCDITEKLPLVANGSDFAGQLVIGFDSEEHSLDKVVYGLAKDAKLGGPNWMRLYDSWPNPEDNAYRVRAWIWCREVTSAC